MKRHFNAFFGLLCIISGLLVLAPLLVRIPLIYSLIQGFLGGIKNSEYKIAYIESVASLIGTFLAITGALWTQNIIDSREEHEKVQKQAAIVYYDLKLNLDSIHSVMESVYPTIKEDILSTEKMDLIIEFRKQKNDKHIYYSESGREHVVALQSVLTSQEINQILSLYGKLAMISVSFNALVNAKSAIEDCNAYNIMRNMFDITQKHPQSYEICYKEKTKNVLAKLAKIADISNEEEG